MTVAVRTDACVGAGQCALIAPDVFDQDDDGIVSVLNSNPIGTDAEAAERAARLCPARAIMIEL